MKASPIRHVLVSFLFAVLCFGIYSNSLNSPFVFDDTKQIIDNPHIRITRLTLKDLTNAAFKSSRSRPVAFFTFALNYYFHQYNVRGYHFVNIVIHIITGILLYIFFKLTLEIAAYDSFNPSFIAFFASLIWVVHPLHTQSVTYIIQRMNSLSGLFFILSFLFYIKGRSVKKRITENGPALNEDRDSSNKAPLIKKNPPKGKKKTKKEKNEKQGNMDSIPLYIPFLWYGGAGLAWIIALGCKQTAATLPFFILLYEYYFFQNLSREWLYRNLKYFLGALILFILIAFIYLGFDPLEKILSLADYSNNEFTFKQRVLTQFRVIIYYLSLIFFPHPSRLNLDYNFTLSHSLVNPISTLLCLGLIFGLLIFACWFAGKNRLISFGILWFFGNLVIESSIIPLAIIYEHRTYLPSIFIILVAVVMISKVPGLKWLGIGVMGATVMLFSLWTYERNNVWKDEITLWSDVVYKSPENITARTTLGIALDSAGRTDEAIQEYKKVLRIKPDYSEAHNNLGIALERQGELVEAFKHYSESLRIDPNNEQTLNNLGVLFTRQERFDESLDYYFKALEIKPYFVEAHYNLGNSLVSLGRLDEAISHFTIALKLRPDHQGINHNMGVALTMKGNYQAAISHFYRVLEINPGNKDAQRSLEYVLELMKKDTR